MELSAQCNLHFIQAVASVDIETSGNHREVVHHVEQNIVRKLSAMEHRKASHTVSMPVRDDNAERIVSNLQPATIRGAESRGMLLAAKFGKELRLVTVDGDVPAGADIG